MTDAPKPHGEMRVLIAALTRKDAVLTSAFLKEAGIASVICDSLDAVCVEMKNDAGALLLAEETLTSNEVQSLNAVLQQQPPWSDWPIIVTRRAGEDSWAAGPDSAGRRGGSGHRRRNAVRL